MSKRKPPLPRLRATFKNLWTQLISVIILTSSRILGIDAFTLQMRVQPGRALGGEAFLEQPRLEILEGDGGDTDVLFEASTQNKYRRRTQEWQLDKNTLL